MYPLSKATSNCSKGNYYKIKNVYRVLSILFLRKIV